MPRQLIDDNTGFDEPTEAAPATTKAALAITDDMGRITAAVSEFDRVSTGLAAIEAAYPKDVAYDLSTPKGMKAAIEHRAAWRDPRITVEKVRKMAKAPLLALGKNIDARAAWLTEQLLEGEQPIDQQIKAEEARREAERAAKAAAEFGRVLAIQEALAGIAIDVAAACGKTSSDIGALLERMQSTEPDHATFQEMMEQANAAWSAGIAKLETAHKAKLWEELEQRRIADEQEAQRIAQQKADEDRARIAAEQKAEAERLAAERAEFERQQAEFRAQQESARLEREQREEADRQAHELAEAQATNTPEQTVQHVLKVEATSPPDATDRGPSVITSPGVGPMGDEQPADAGLAEVAATARSNAMGRMGASIAPEVESDSTPAADLFGAAPAPALTTVPLDVALADCREALREALLIVQTLVTDMDQTGANAKRAADILARVSSLRALGGI